MGFLDDYEPVEDRLAKFWADHPEGRITTELVSQSEGFYIVKASVWRGADTEVHPITRRPPDATGLASEKETQRGVNSTSALENCETSAIGRALANLGYAPKGRRPSREEMSKTTGSPESSESAGRRTQSAGKESESTNGEVAAPTPAGSIDAQTVKDLQAVLGGPTNALHAARARFGDSIYALKNLTPEQAKALLP